MLDADMVGFEREGKNWQFRIPNSRTSGTRPCRISGLRFIAQSVGREKKGKGGKKEGKRKEKKGKGCTFHSEITVPQSAF
jgi:hypothetical protein